MQLPQVGADLARNDRQQPQVLLGVRARRLPHVEQADEVAPNDRKHQVEAVRELSSHLGRGQVRVQRGQLGEVAEEPREHLAHASPCPSLRQDDELLRASGLGFQERAAVVGHEEAQVVEDVADPHVRLIG